ncbi:hypothetical protein DBV15_04642 [Temnothorax longispinosus]|uniref:Uncharacterized protein n=1 Tax=Temnothorax longispinosus TaxID=300112 RepID=A0A4S2JRQ3_9HYME|nr:hypothetical protein DBV15_04642 [Temnothorax longispinosus]
MSEQFDKEIRNRCIRKKSGLDDWTAAYLRRYLRVKHYINERICVPRYEGRLIKTVKIISLLSVRREERVYRFSSYLSQIDVEYVDNSASTQLSHPCGRVEIVTLVQCKLYRPLAITAPLFPTGRGVALSSIGD